MSQWWRDLFAFSGDAAELWIALAAVFLALIAPAQGRRLAQWFARAVGWWAERPKWTATVLLLAPAVIRLVLLIWMPAPLPRAMEEHNHLLQADTYAHGRLANPPHPLAVILQSYQIVEWPTYVSSRPPFCGLFPAIGELFFKSPFLGNVFGVCLLNGVLFWMFLQWMPRQWATAGGFLVTLQFCIFGFWMNSYWEPTVTILGAALLLGLAPGLLKQPHWQHAAIFVLGAALLIGTRPYEGIAAILLEAGWLLYAFTRKDQQPYWRARLVQLAVPLAIGAIAVIALQMKYDTSTTGRLLKMPYQIWRTDQTSVPAFFWQPISTKPLLFYYSGFRHFADWEVAIARGFHRHPLITALHLVDRHDATIRDVIGTLFLIPFLCWSSEWLALKSVRGRMLLFAGFVALALSVFFAKYNGPGLLANVVLLAVLLVRFKLEPVKRLPLLLVLAGAVVTSAGSFYMNNYFLAFVPATLVLLITGAQNLWRWDEERGTGASLLACSACGAVLLFAIEVAGGISGHRVYGAAEMGRFDLEGIAAHQVVAKQLAQLKGKQLIFVDGNEVGGSVADYVWNLADIDAQKIVWARDLRPEWTAAAVQYFSGRQVWLLEHPYDESRVQLKPYPVASLPKAAKLDELPMPDRE